MNAEKRHPPPNLTFQLTASGFFPVFSCVVHSFQTMDALTGPPPPPTPNPSLTRQSLAILSQSTPWTMWGVCSTACSTWTESRTSSSPVTQTMERRPTKARCHRTTADRGLADSSRSQPKIPIVTPLPLILQCRQNSRRNCTAVRPPCPVCCGEAASLPTADPSAEEVREFDVQHKQDVDTYTPDTLSGARPHRNFLRFSWKVRKIDIF